MQEKFFKNLDEGPKQPNQNNSEEIGQEYNTEKQAKQNERMVSILVILQHSIFVKLNNDDQKRN